MSMSTWAQIAIPELKSRVTDLTATLPPHEVVLLEQKLSNFEEKKGSQIAVLIVPTTRPESIEQYAFRVAESWKLGRKNTDDGALLVIAKNDRTLRIEVGYGLEGVLPDAKVKQIIEQIIIPQFKSGNLSQGIGAGVDAMLRLIQGESLPSPVAKKSMGLFTDSTGALDVIVPILIGFFILGKILEPLLGRLGGAVVTSIGVGLISWLLMASIAIAITVAIFALIMNLFHSPGTGIYRGGRSHWPNDSYRGGGGGFGGGGFSGGGGGFGGGGASGRW
ncbi:MAG: TPM domain-containing protein [Nitrosomonas sp.]